MTFQIVVLDDGETWSNYGKIMTLTKEGYNKLCEDGEISDLTEYDIISTKEIIDDID